MSLSESCTVPHTCSYIDECIDTIKTVVAAQENGFCIQDLQTMQETCIEQLESLRSQNSDLREWGARMELAVTTLEKRWDEMRSHFDWLERSM